VYSLPVFDVNGMIAKNKTIKSTVAAYLAATVFCRILCLCPLELIH
jgi:hypothetical protein